MFYCTRQRWLNGPRTAPAARQPGTNQHARPAPFVVIQNGKPIFTVHAYSIEQARATVAATIAGETVVVARDGASR